MEMFDILIQHSFFKLHNDGLSELRLSEHYMLLTC